MRFTTADAAVVTGGDVDGADQNFDGASIDSRELAAGALFVPIVADRDGHDFIGTAIDRGAPAYLTAQHKGAQPELEQPGLATAVRVADTAVALTQLGSAARDRLQGHVVGITGSVGKTSTKDLLASVLAADGAVVHASDKSFNNELGVPLTLVNAPEDAEAVVVEMGARGVGHIAHLCAVARPTIGVVTMVGAVHTSEFGDLATVALAKGELVEAIAPDGWVVLNADNAPVAAMAARSAAPTLTFGVESPADVFASDIVLDAELRPIFRLHTPGGSADVKLGVRGVHNVANALAAAAVGHIVGLAPEAISRGLAAAGLSPWRMEVLRAPGGATIINDAYNANPMSMAAGLRALQQVDATRRVAVLGVMAELGTLHDTEHRAVAALAADLGIEVIAFAESSYGVDSVDTITAAAAALGTLGPTDAVLVKGSRVAELERLAAVLVADESSP